MDNSLDHEDLVSRGFRGFQPLRGLARGCSPIPSPSGVYVVTLESPETAFVPVSVGGHFKGNDPGVPVSVLEAKQVDGTPTKYVGRATSLRKRIDLLARYGRGEPIAHQVAATCGRSPNPTGCVLRGRSTPIRSLRRPICWTSLRPRSGGCRSRTSCAAAGRWLRPDAIRWSAGPPRAGRPSTPHDRIHQRTPHDLMPRKPAANLVKALEDTRPAIERGLVEAEQELAELNERRADLEAVIARARTVLADNPPRPAAQPGERLTLHEAIERVLDAHDNRWLTVHELADAINNQQLYEKRDRSPVDPSQIHARANKYPARFEKDGARIRRVVR